jgi:hypothetical protein
VLCTGIAAIIPSLLAFYSLAVAVRVSLPRVPLPFVPLVVAGAEWPVGRN